MISHLPSSFHLHLISDATGETLTTMAKAAAVQYPQVRPIEHVHPLVRTEKQLERVLKEVEQAPGIVLYTVVKKALIAEIERRCRILKVPCLHDWDALKQYSESLGLKLGAINPNTFQEAQYKLGSLCSPDGAARESAIAHMIECCEIMEKTGSDILSVWLADGTNYAGQDSIRKRKHQLEYGLSEVYKHLPKNGRMLIEYKFFEPAFYHTDLFD